MHPESPDRLSAIRDRLIASGLDQYIAMHDAPQATLEQLCRVHPEEYVQRLTAAAPEHGIVHLDPDTAMGPHTLKAALRAAGAGVMAVDMVMGGEARTVFCAVRPPGHHAERMRAMGFCFFNNIAVAARHAIAVHDLKRVAIVDFDVHHGNGTEEIFADDPHVLMVGLFQYPLYPYSGIPPEAANIRCTPVKAGARGDVVRDLMENDWLPSLEEFRPQMLLISAGFDAHVEDDMASLALIDNDYVWMTDRLRHFADQHCAGRVVSMLEGGYALSALGRSVTGHIKALADI